MMTALPGADANVAVTGPLPVGVPCAAQTASPVFRRPPHWTAIGAHESPRPLTAVVSR